MKIEDKIVDIIANQAGCKVTDIKLNSNYIDDLGMDSLDIVETVMYLEEEFAIEIPDEDIEKMSVVEEIIDYIKQKKKDMNGKLPKHLQDKDDE